MMRRSVLILLFLFAAAASQAADVPGRWTRTGPDGGAVSALAAAPSRPATIYAGMAVGGVFRSTDGGATWAFAGAGLGRGIQIESLAVEASRPNSVYAASNFGLYKSTDGGVSWKPVSIGSAPHFTTAVAADPRRPGAVYAALSQEGIFASLNGGATWKHLGNAPPTSQILVIDPADTSTIYAANDATGIFKSTDAGAHWQALHRGLPSVPPGVAALAIDPQDPQTLFLSPGNSSVFRSGDGGRRWTAIGAGVGTGGSIRALAVDPALSSTLYAGTSQNGVLRSTDGGHTWHPASAGLPDASTHVLLATRSGLFAGTSGGVAQSHNRAATWQTGHGLSATLISSLAIANQNPPRLYAFDQAGILFKSANRGASWQPLPYPGGPDSFQPVVGPVVVDPHNRLRLALGRVGSVDESTDGGLHWQTFFQIDCIVPDHIVLDPSDPGVAYANGGFAVSACSLQPDACSSYKYDHGTVTCLRDPAISQTGVPVVATDPAVPGHLFAISGGLGLFQSFDAGASWSLLSSAIHPSTLVFDPASSSTLYAPVSPGGVARSTDGGATWQVATAGLPTEIAVVSLVIDPTLPSTLYAATPYDVYRSTDSGATWEQIGTGIEEVTVSQLALDPRDPHLLYAGTFGGGVMVLHLE